MNSITYLDSILTRSLTTSRSGSATNTPGATTPSASGSFHSGGPQLGQHGQQLNRRASDYSLARERERQKRKIAASLGLTALDGNEAQQPRRSRTRRRGSGSAKFSDAEGVDHKHDEVDDGSKLSSSRHPKSFSEGNTFDQRARLKRTESTPAPMRSAPVSRGWTSLWGFGGFFEDAQGQNGEWRHHYTNSAPYDNSNHHEARVVASGRGRRASTSDADAHLAGFAPDALLSEREREDVVDLEGYDPDEDLEQLPSTPPSTPHPSAIQNKDTQSIHAASVPSTASKLSSLLFGALNPLTDDYFGPQGPSRFAGRRKASEASDKKRFKSERSRRGSQASRDSHSEASSSGHGHDRQESKAISQEEGTPTPVDGTPLDPPPPYSHFAATTSSDAAGQHMADADELMSPRSSRARRISQRLTCGLKKAFEVLQKIILAILLLPLRPFQRKRDSSAHKIAEPIRNDTECVSSSSLQQYDSRYQTASQIRRPSAARHMAGKRVVDEKSAQNFANSESDSDSEPVTEDQAAARALLKAQQEEKAPAAKLSPRASSRLLPNPHPVDPLLAHDRNAKARNEKEAQQRHNEQFLVSQTDTSGQMGRMAVVSRGPLSSLIHHSPKILVLDLDETLIHSTSRSPTWQALADKSKSRLAVTTGGSLLGLEGLGGVLGLRGQVGVRPHQVEVVLEGRSIIYHVYKRPHVDTFLRKVAAWYHVIVFTASVQEYADPVIDWLDQGRGLISARLFRESCTFRNGSYYKNLALVDADLSKVCLVDNSPASYMINQANGIPIEGWTHDPNDECLLDLLPVLDSLRFASDVRHILGIRGFADAASAGGAGLKQNAAHAL